MATLAQARLAACDKRKYATYQILSLVPVPKPGIGTMAVDEHWRLYYDPKFLDGLTIPQAAGVILHESAHLLFGHSQRAKMLGITLETHDDWNLATDASINDILRAEGVELPPDGVYPDKLGFPGGKAAETYYDLIRRKRQEQEQAAQQAQEQEQQGQDGDESEQGDSDSQEQEDASESEPDAGNGQSEDTGDGDEPQDAQDTGDESNDGEDGQTRQQGPETDAQAGQDDDSGTEPEGDDPGRGCGDQGDADSEAPESEHPTGGCPDRMEQGDGSDSEGLDAESEQPVARYPGEGGSCSDGIRRPWEDDPPADEDGDEQDGEGDATPRGVPKWEQDLIREQVAKAAEKFKGNMPGGMLGEIDRILNPRIDPRRLLMRAVRANTDNACRSGGGRFTYRRPARRPSFGGTVRPSNFQPIPRIVVLVDTSGSMDVEDLGLALGLVGNVLNGLRLRDGVQVVCADAAIQWAGKVFDPSKIVLAGRGGTEMGEMMEDVVRDAKRGEKPELVICVTDAATDWPRKKLDVPCVACVTRGSRDNFWVKRIPAWIETVILKETE